MWLSSVLLASIPLSFAIAAWWSGRKQTVNAGKYLLRFVFVLPFVFIGAIVSHYMTAASIQEQYFISHSSLNMIMLGLVLFMAIILIAFSRNYMAGEVRINLYWRRLLNTLAAVTLVVISNHLLLFWFGWLCISLALHQLLTYYPERPRAVLAAHKKFLLARTAEACLFIAIVLLYQQHQTFFISDLIAHFSRVAIQPDMSLSVIDQIAAVFIAMTALIKCAQLPVHGWLIQVVEAPTPVSALLHAGVINLGGFLLILFAPLFIQVPVAQWLVLIVAGLTTLICALVMSTRISLKVRLAWSTSAQMGLMLVECALGLFELALLHLLTHSAYKAYAFLHSGSAVQQHLQQCLAPAGRPAIKDGLLALGISTVLVGLTLIWLDYQGALSVWLLLILALTMLIAQRHGETIKAKIWPVIALTLGLLVAYGGMKSLLVLLLPTANYFGVAAFSLADLWIMLVFIILFVLSGLLHYWAEHRHVQKISTILFAGLYLDEWLTRLTLKIWPLRLPVSANTKIIDHVNLKPAKEY